MKETLTALLLTFVTTLSFSQTKKTFYYGGVVTSLPAYLSDKTETNKTIGLGLELQYEHFFSHRFSLTASAGYSHFQGKYTYLNFAGNSVKDTTIKTFAIVPVFAGLRFYCWKAIYLGAETGALIAAHKNAGSFLAVAPSIGYKIVTSGKHNLDVGLRLLNTAGFGAPEGNSLKGGGYGIWSFKLAYGF